MKKISYMLKEDGYTIDSWCMPPFDGQPVLEVENEDDILPGLTKVINGVVVQPSRETLQLENTKRSLRNEREMNCFPYINRGQAWYNNLTENQKNELQYWYEAWLNVTETLVEPTKPMWLK